MKANNFISGIAVIAIILIIAMVVFNQLHNNSLVIVSFLLLVLTGLFWLLFKRTKPILSVEMPYVKITWNMLGIKIHNHYGDEFQSPRCFDTKEQAEQLIEKMNSAKNLKTKVSLEIEESK